MIWFLLIVAMFAFYVMRPEERARVIRPVVGTLRQAGIVAAYGHPQHQPFEAALRGRTPFLLVTPILVAANVLTFVFMVLGSGSLSDPETLVRWGGNLGPRTTNGEWWRLLSATYVHSGTLPLLATLIGLIPVGLVLERLVGHLATAATYVGAGLIASIVVLIQHPVTVNVGGSSAVFGLHGLLIAALVWNVRRRSTATVPIGVLKTLLPAIGLFLLLHAATQGIGIADAFALLVGVIYGMSTAKRIEVRKPSVRQVGIAFGSTFALVALAAIPLHGLTDVRPEIEHVAEVEARTADAYQRAVDQFKLGALTNEALAHVIDRTIVPELQAVSARLTALGKVPPQQRPLLDSAREYLRLRHESWRIRAQAIQKRSSIALRQADTTERASLDVLEKIKPTNQ